MAYHGYCKYRQRHKWRCPKSPKKWNINCSTSCSNSSYGRVIYTRKEDNLCFFTPIPRGSTLWKERCKRRTASERFNKKLKEDYLLEKGVKSAAPEPGLSGFLLMQCAYILMPWLNILKFISKL